MSIYIDSPLNSLSFWVNWFPDMDLEGWNWSGDYVISPRVKV